MSDATRDDLEGVVRLTVNGEELKLRYDLAAQARLCEVLTVEDLTSMLGAFQNVTASSLPTFVWAGLLWEKPDLTLEEVRSFFMPMVPTMNAVQRACSLAMFGPGGPPESETNTEEDADPQSPDSP